MGKLIILAIFVLVLVLASCSHKATIIGEPQIYDVTTDIHSLDIQISAAVFTIVHGEKFTIESNLKYLSVSEKDGVLTIEEKTKVGTNYTDAWLQLCLPSDIVFEEVKIATGAAKLNADSLSANSMTIKLGAGKARFGTLNAYSGIDMKGGAGEVTIVNGTLNNLNLNLGVGKFKLTAALLGNSHLQFGVGESNLTLIGRADDYKLDITKGIGNINIDGYPGSYIISGNVRNYVKIQGGIGAANIGFRNE